MKKSNIFFGAIFVVLIAIIFKNWLLSPNIIGGDWPFFFQQYVNQFGFLPPIWDSVHGDGLGGQSLIYALDSYLYFTGWVFSILLHIPWQVVNKIVWYGMFLVLSIWSSFYLFKTIFLKSFIWQRFLVAMLYTTNTYILLVVGGGQMGVALAYAVAPFVLGHFIMLRESLSTQDRKFVIANSLLAGTLLSIQVLFDFRFAYITMCCVIVYLLVGLPFTFRKILSILFYILFIPLSLSILLHAFWLLPLIFFRQNPVVILSSAYTSVASLQFFSFATFENTISLLHPYWPENIFGKVGFMKPEFLVVPLIAFSSLFFIKPIAQKKAEQYKEQRIILFFALLGLLGAFLAKGANDPFGSIFIWMFEHVPGFVMFRDPTKWYLLIAVSYSVLIPFTVYSIYNSLNSKIPHKGDPGDKNKKFIISLIPVLFLLFWLFTIRQAIFGQLSGTFAYHEIPAEYIQLRDTLITDTHYSRTLWLPKLQRFGFYDQAHPAVEGATALGATTSADMIKDLQQKNAEQELSNLSIKYVIVPFDSGQEIFLKDRKYNPEERNTIVSQLNKIPWLQRSKMFKNIAVYTTKNSKDRFWMQGTRKVTYQFVSDGKYDLTISPGPAEKLIFNETYSPYWKATNGNITIDDKKFGMFNSFYIPSNKKSTVITLSYAPVQYFIIGRIISLMTLIAVIYFFLKFR